MAADDRVIAEIGIVHYPDAQLAAIWGLTDLFRIAGEVSRASGEADPPVLRVSHWRQVEAGAEAIFDSHPGSPNRPSLLIAPPSLVMPEKMQAMPALAAWLIQRHASGALVCSVCAGAFLLGEAGLLDGRAATTHWAFAETFAARFPNIRLDIDRMVIDNGDVITAGGMLAWTDLGLTLVERLLGPSVMRETARFLVIDPPGRTQQPYEHFARRVDHGDAAILKVQRWLQVTGGKDHSVRALARHAGLEERTFLRRFRKATGLRPTEYAQQIRISRAREALELGRRPIAEIAWDVGYGDVATFRRLFRRVTGLTPTAYRRRFGVAY